MPHSQPCCPHSEQMTFLPTLLKKQRPSGTTSIIFPPLHLSPCFTLWNFLWYLHLSFSAILFPSPFQKKYWVFKNNNDYVSSTELDLLCTSCIGLSVTFKRGISGTVSGSWDLRVSNDPKVIKHFRSSTAWFFQDLEEILLPCLALLVFFSNCFCSHKHTQKHLIF